MRRQYNFQMLAPAQAHVGRGFRCCQSNTDLHKEYLSQLQRLRGRLYLSDGAIRGSDLDDEGHFRMHGDEDAWHLLLLDETSEVIGCSRYLVHPHTINFNDLRVSQCALAREPGWVNKVRNAVESELNIARIRNLSYVEIGGWALSEEWRGTKAALEIALGSYALARLWGGAIGCCTATARHGSASILRRLGGQSLNWDGEDLPPYHDSHYGCSMELLRFDDPTIASRFIPVVNQLTRTLAGATVLTTHPWEAAEYMRAASSLSSSRGLSGSWAGDLVNTAFWERSIPRTS
jgi:hypothetical protein